ncbi:type II and III secretion system protein family protein [Stakelama marina]|uniref:Type II and III secretion system protein family protein n=1 Tax=Stakelama marina TaxID=2826939 RepID=A0A8T4IH26_9SPHN|nr:type II and III secretion system protein family protein [Stakelama marina]MBR0552365.1 type II and III secretion system protein family protein [Stakelama marina]
MRIKGNLLSVPMAAAVAIATATTPSAPTSAQTVRPEPTSVVQLDIGRGRLVTLSAPMSDLFVADDKVADVQVRSPTQLYIFAKGAGETNVYATSKSGAVVYATTVRVGQNFNSLQSMLSLAMPDAKIATHTMNGVILLTGTVANPDDAAEAEQLVQAFVGDKTKVITRLKTAVPLQVNLQVKFAEVSRSFAKTIGNNLQTRDTTGGFQFGVASGRSVGTIGSVDTSSLPQLDASSRFGFPAGTISLPYDPKIGDFVYPNTGTKFDFSNLGKGGTRTALGYAGKLLGLDILGALDLGEKLGQVTTLNTTNLSALSGETGSFLAGGEIPIPISQGLGAVSVQYKQYGVSLSYTPTVLSDGRISLRVRPEVSQLSAAGAVTLQNGVQIPALTTRRAETTIEVGSGQSFMIAGLLSNNHQNSIDKTPGIGDMPILGALFRSNEFQRNETELMIVITPYLVKPVNPDQIVLPTDGYKAPTDLERVFLGKMESGKSGTKRPMPTMAPQGDPAPSLGASTPLPTGPKLPEKNDKPAAVAPRKMAGDDGHSPAPGFSNQ